MIENHYHLLAYQTSQIEHKGEHVFYAGFFQLLNKGMSAYLSDEAVDDYKHDFHDRTAEFFYNIFEENGIHCEGDPKSISLSGEGTRAGISFCFPARFTAEVSNIALEIEKAAAMSIAALRSFKMVDLITQEGTTIFSADFKKLNEQETTDALHILISAFAAHEGFYPVPDIENQKADVTIISLTFPFYGPVIGQIVAMEITNAAALVQGSIPLRITHESIPATKPGKPPNSNPDYN